MPAIDAAATAAATTVGVHGRGRPRELAQVARAVLVVEDADDHERGGLERGVGEEQHAAGDHRRRRAPAEHGDHEAELADRAVRQQQLEVVLAQGPQAAERSSS